MTAGLSIVVAALSLSCAAHSDRPAAADVGPGSVVRATLVTPRACVAQGPEHCFDARDDNCNGIIDEGCGVRTGPVAFAIAWNAPTADVDLLVTDPNGELVEVGRPTAAGLVKERDCPSGKKDDCTAGNFENVYLDCDSRRTCSDPKKGRYRVRIRLERLEDEDTPIHVTFGARVGQKAYAAELELTRPEDEKELLFEL